jgi:4-amino-4-deoxy-L-arabinose transferase-like glycosyltransferase
MSKDEGSDPMGDRTWAGSTSAWLAALLSVGLVLRVLYALLQGGVGAKDPDEYDAYAWSLLQGEGYRHGPLLARRPPLLPLLLAASYAIGGHSPIVARLLQVAMGTGLCALVFLIARRLYGERTALVATGIAVLHPYLVYYSGYVMAETPAALLLAWLTLLWLGWEDSTPARSFLFGGVLAGLASLTRSVFLGLPAVAAAWSFSTLAGVRRALLATVLFTAGTVMVVLPWTVRNYLRLGVVVPVQAGGAWQAYEYARWYADPLFPTFRPELLGERARAFRAEHKDLYQRFRQMPENQKDAAALAEAVAYFSAHPLEYVRGAWRKLYWFWRPSDFAIVAGRRVTLSGGFAAVIYLPLLVLAVPGWTSLPPAHRRLFPLLILYLTAMHSLVFHGTPRFRFPIYPHLIVLAAGGAMRLARRLERGGDGSGERPSHD